jgi:hypothetical protein
MPSMVEPSCRIVFSTCTSIEIGSPAGPSSMSSCLLDRPYWNCGPGAAIGPRRARTPRGPRDLERDLERDLDRLSCTDEPVRAVVRS